MALTLIDEIKTRLPSATFVFAVPHVPYEQERKWAEYYGVEIVRADNIIHYAMATNALLRAAKVPYRILKGRPINEERGQSARDANVIHDEFMSAYEKCDVVVDMQGISYVGDGVRSSLEGMFSYSNLYYANRFKKPFIHFIQSFGPFDDWRVRWFARRDFNQMELLFARGEKCADYCRAIVKDEAKVKDFPDSAILLRTADDDWVRDYLAKFGFAEGKYAVLSPSAVIYRLRAQETGSAGAKHVETYALIAERFLSRGENVLLVPHMYSDRKSECDREVCRRVVDLLRHRGGALSGLALVEDDLDVWQAKGLISAASQAVVSRYHALVAAVSTNVPVVTVGWNVKYADLMGYYGLDAMSIDTRTAGPAHICDDVFAKLDMYAAQSSLVAGLKDRQDENSVRVGEAFDLLVEWLKRSAT